MKSRLKKFLMNPWTVTIGGGIVLSVVCDLIKKESVFNTIKTIVSKVGKIITIILNFNIKVWWLLLGVALIIFVLVMYTKSLEHAEPQFLEYMQDELLGYKWRWTWQKDLYGKYRIDELHPICSKCETPLVENLYEYGDRYKCLRCKEGYNKQLPEFENVKILVHDNVRRKYFSNT